MQVTDDELNKAAETKKGIKAVLFSALLYIGLFGASAAISLYGIYYAVDWSYNTLCQNKIIRCN